MARRHSSKRSCDRWKITKSRCGSAAAGAPSVWPAAKLTCPVLEALESLQNHDQHGGLTRLLRAVAPSWYSRITPTSENESSAARLAAETAGGSQERLKREIAALLEEAGRIQPVILWFDDVHWADPSTTDLILYLAQRMEHTRSMIIVTARPSDLAQAKHPFLTVKLDLLAHGQCREIAPGPLDVPAIARYVSMQFADHAFPEGFPQLIHQRTEGHPLFVADLLRDLRRRQVIRQQDGRWIMTADLHSLERELPPSVRSLVQRKIEALDDERSADAGRGKRPWHRFRDDDHRRGAWSRRRRRRGSARASRARACAWCGSSSEEETMDRALTLRYRFAHHVYQNAFYDSLRVTRRASYAEPRNRQSAGQPLGGRAVRVRGRHCASVRNGSR